MVIAKFKKHVGYFKSVQVLGHACYSKYGKDIVCAAVSSALQMLINGLVEVLKINCKLEQNENEIFLELCTQNNSAQFNAGQAFIESFCLHLKILSKSYPKTIDVIILEV